MTKVWKNKIKYSIADIKNLLSKDLLFYLLADILFYCTSNVVGSFLGILIASKVAPDRLDVVGFVFTTYQIMYSFASLIAGGLTKKLKRIGKENMVAIAYSLSGLITIFIGFSTNILLITILFGLIGFFDGIAYPLKNSNYSKIIKEGNDEKAWGILSFVTTAIPALFLIPVGIFANDSTMPIIFAIAGVLSIFSGFFFGKVNVQRSIDINRNY